MSVLGIGEADEVWRGIKQAEQPRVGLGVQPALGLELDEPGAQRGDERVRLDGLDEVIVRAAEHALARAGRVLVRHQEHERNGRRVRSLAQRAQCRVAVHALHVNVVEDEVGARLARELDTFRARARADGVEVVGAGQLDDDVAEHGVILDHEDAVPCGGSGACGQGVHEAESGRAGFRVTRPLNHIAPRK